ncbi:MAG: 3'-5' exonuclease [Clostridia bacterium]|nr:3'-5' exonuclease [Clostridia bacterium]
MKNIYFYGERYICDTDNYVAFDIETTGLHDSEIVDFAAVKIREGKVEGTYRTFIRPKKPIPTDVTLINGITDEMVANFPSFSEVAEGILDFFGDDMIVGHCLEKFSLKILCDELVRAGLEPVQNDYIDIMEMSEKCYGVALGSHSLKNISRFLDVKIEGSIGALLDVRTIIECYEKMCITMREAWQKGNIYSELSEDLHDLIGKMKRKKNVSEIRRALISLHKNELCDPVMRCAVYIPLIKYEIYIDRFEEELRGELVGAKRDFERGLLSRMSIRDIERLKADIDYCFHRLNKPRKKNFLFFWR